MKYQKQSFLAGKILGFTFAVSILLWGCLKEDNGAAPAISLPAISVSDLTVTEGDVDQVHQLEVTLTGDNKTNAIISFAAVPGSALSGSDYKVLTTGKIQFAPGETKKIIEISITGDDVKEPKESFQIKFYNPLNATLTKDLVTVTILDDDDNTAGLVIPTSGYTSPTSYPGYHLAWSDEFDSTALNLNNWTFELGDGCPNNCGWGNNELQYYRQENTSVVNGNLVITALNQKFGSRDYTSSRLVSKGKKQFKFGRIDIRAALPKGKGLWPALWMLGSNIDAVSWPACGEVDMMELTGDLPNRVVGTVHYGASVSQHQYTGMSDYLTGTDNFHDQFHVFSINWENNLIEFMVDGQVYQTITPTSLGTAPYPFNKNFFFIFNVAVGGDFPGNPDPATAFPQYMVVDYIRVFQK
jgi:beta-glucanase (GH16 family)